MTSRKGTGYLVQLSITSSVSRVWRHLARDVARANDGMSNRTGPFSWVCQILNFENRTIISEDTAIFVKPCFFTSLAHAFNMIYLTGIYISVRYMLESGRAPHDQGPSCFKKETYWPYIGMQFVQWISVIRNTFMLLMLDATHICTALSLHIWAPFKPVNTDRKATWASHKCCGSQSLAPTGGE